MSFTALRKYRQELEKGRREGRRKKEKLIDLIPYSFVKIEFQRKHQQKLGPIKENEAIRGGHV